MKNNVYLGMLFAFLLLVSCKTPQLVACEDVTKTNDMPWLYSIAEKGVSEYEQKLLSIDKVVYSIGESATTYVGFDVLYETVCCETPYRYIYDCDGEIVTWYGGWLSCNGECDINIISRKNLYTAK